MAAGKLMLFNKKIGDNALLLRIAPDDDSDIYF